MLITFGIIIIRNNSEVKALEKRYITSNFQEKIKKLVRSCPLLVLEEVIPDIFFSILVPTFAKEVSFKRVSLTGLFHSIFY